MQMRETEESNQKQPTGAWEKRTSLVRDLVKSAPEWIVRDRSSSSGVRVRGAQAAELEMQTTGATITAVVLMVRLTSGQNSSALRA